MDAGVFETFWGIRMNESKRRLRSLDGLQPPDLWNQIGIDRVDPRHDDAVPAQYPSRQRFVAGVLAACVFAAAGALAWLALRPDRGQIVPIGPTPPANSVDQTPADVAIIVCGDGTITMQTPVVRAQRDGVHFLFENPGGAKEYALHHDSTEGGPLEGDRTDVTSSIAPGTITVSCLPNRSSEVDAPTAALTVIDPAHLYVSNVLPCPETQKRIRLPVSPGESADHAYRRVSGIRSTDMLETPRYPDSPQYSRIIRVVLRDGSPVARFFGFPIGREWKLIIDACEGSGIAGA